MIPIYHKRLFNVLYLGICFLVLSSFFSAMGNMQKTILASSSNENIENVPDGFTCLAIDYSVTAISLWFAPSIISIIGPKIALIIGAASDLLYIMAFYVDDMWILYTVSGINGIGSALLWTGQNNYVVTNSTSQTIQRDNTIYWFFYQMSTLIGNLLVYISLTGTHNIDENTRSRTVSIISSGAAVGVVLFLFLPAPMENDDAIVISKSQSMEENKTDNPITALNKAWSVFIDKRMAFLSIVFIYFGIQYSFSNGIYSSSVSFTLSLAENTRELVCLSGIFIGLGIVLGGMLQFVWRKMLSQLKFEKTFFLVFGITCQMVGYILVYINLPNESVFRDTWESSKIIRSNVYLAMLCSVFIGVGNITLGTQVFSLVAQMFPNESSQTAAVINFIKFVSAAVSYYYSTIIGLHPQLIILFLFAILAIIFFLIENTIIKLKPLPNINNINTNNA